MNEIGRVATDESGGEFQRLVARTRGFQPWRRVFHASSGLALAFGPLLLGFDGRAVLLVLGLLLVCAVTIDLVRLRIPELNKLFFRTLSALASPREASRFASSTWYLVGVIVTYAVFPLWALAAVLVLGLADPTASVIGRRWGRVHVGTGSVEGASAFFLVSALILAATVGGLMRPVVVALVVTCVELLPTPLDDNLTIPLAVAGTLTILA